MKLHHIAAIVVAAVAGYAVGVMWPAMGSKVVSSVTPTNAMSS